MPDPAAPAPAPNAIAAPPLAAARRPCPNCGHPVPERYCGACGQRHTRGIVPLRQMLMDALDDQLTLNSALPRTLAGLLRPGFLTREYAAGRIVRYIPPMRLYLLASLAFFLALPLSEPTNLGVQVSADATLSAGQAPARPGTGPAVQVDTTGMPAWMKPLGARLEKQAQHLQELPPEETARRLIAAMARNAPKAMFVLLPLFALLLKLLYARRGRMYAEHFVFALHAHSFAFLGFALALLAASTLATLALQLGVVGYLYLAMRRVYGQGWLKTAAKLVLLGAAYGMAVVIALSGVAIVAALTA